MIYLDNAATTSCAPEVLDAMLPFFRDSFANASSIDHLPGALAKRAVEEARAAVALLVGAKPEDVIFTSGSTEANNLVLATPMRVATTPVEHPSILEPFEDRQAANKVVLPIDEIGRVRLLELTDVLASFEGQALLVSAIATNNETGVEQEFAALRESCTRVGTFLHFDATQAVSTRQFNLKAGDADGLSLSAHKIHGPKGVGALIATSRLRRQLAPRTRGGGHESGLRPGTLNVPGIIGFGAAARLLAGKEEKNRKAYAELRAAFLSQLGGVLPPGLICPMESRSISPQILSMRINGINSRALLGAIGDQIAFSLGSACATAKAEPSHVLSALGWTKREIAETFRVSFSRYDTLADVVEAASIIGVAAKSLATLNLSTF